MIFMIYYGYFNQTFVCLKAIKAKFLQSTCKKEEKTSNKTFLNQSKIRYAFLSLYACDFVISICKLYNYYRLYKDKSV